MLTSKMQFKKKLNQIKYDDFMIFLIFYGENLLNVPQTMK